MKPKYTFIIYRDCIRQFRWTCKASNGRVVADSSESYHRRVDARRFPESILKITTVGPIKRVRIIDQTIK